MTRYRSLHASFLLLMFFFSNISFGQSFGVSSLPSLEWQKKSLEDDIKNEIKTNLSPILKSNEYLINVDIVTAIPETPDFYTSEHDLEQEETSEGRLSEAEQLALETGMTPEEAQAKLDKENEEKNQEKDSEDKASKEDEEKEQKSNIKYTDVSPEEDTAEEYIIFSKFGIEAPLVDNFNDFRPDGKVLLTMDGSQLGGSAAKARKAEKEIERLKQSKEEQINQLREQFKAREEKLAKQLADVKNQKREPSLIEQAWKYNQATNIFNNLRSVAITVTMNDQLKQVTRDSVERTLNSLSFGLGNITPTVNIDYIPMDEVKVDSRTMADKIAEFMRDHSLAIGLILASLVLGAVAYVLFRMYSKLTKESESASMNMSGQLNSENKNEEDESEAESGAGGGAGEAIEGSAGLDGFERFKAFLEKSKMDACMLVKKWIKTGEQEENDALRGLVQQLENSSLIEIFKLLDEDEKTQWKSLLNTSLSPEKLKKSGQFVSNQIVEEIILPSVIVDEEACDLLLKIRPQQAARMIEDKPELGMIMLNVMNTKFVNQILADVSSDMVENVISSGLEYSQEAVEEQMADLKRALRKYLDKPNKIPFLQKVKDLIPLAKASKELPLYKALASTGETYAIIELAQKKLPSCLIDELPETLLKNCLTRYPMTHKVPLLLALPEERREFYLEISAPEGTKARDLIEIEFESAENNLMVQKKIREERDSLIDHFTEFMRDYLKQDKAYESDVQQVIVDWAEGLVAGQQNTQNIRHLNEAG